MAQARGIAHPTGIKRISSYHISINSLNLSRHFGVGYKPLKLIRIGKYRVYIGIFIGPIGRTGEFVSGQLTLNFGRIGKNGGEVAVTGRLSKGINRFYSFIYRTGRRLGRNRSV